MVTMRSAGGQGHGGQGQVYHRSISALVARARIRVAYFVKWRKQLKLAPDTLRLEGVFHSW